jgi:GTP-binding protein Era
MESPTTRSGSPRDDYRCGYVALVGRPNVGKSTLMNRVLGQKLSIVTAKPQTTRQRIAGIKTTGQGQVIYVDTPGIHLAANSALNRYMNRIAQASFHDVDLILFLIEADRWTREDEHVARSLAEVRVPVLLVVNKIDRIPDKSRLLVFLEKEVRTDRFDEVFLISAKTGNGIERLEEKVLDTLPFSRPYYDQDMFTDRTERFLAAELIREQLMIRLHQELPYALTVEIEEFKHEKGLVRIGAIIWVEREGQKQIVIGKAGQVLKQIGSQARQALQQLLDEKVFLRCWVKVSKDWSDNVKALKQFGYEDS